MQSGCDREEGDLGWPAQLEPQKSPFPAASDFAKRKKNALDKERDDVSRQGAPACHRSHPQSWRRGEESRHPQLIAPTHSFDNFPQPGEKSRNEIPSSCIKLFKNLVVSSVALCQPTVSPFPPSFLPSPLSISFCT